MAYQTFSSFNQTGFEGMLLYSSSVVPGFIPMLLFVFFLILLFGISSSTERRTGRADYPAAFAVAGWTTLIIAFVMDLIANLVNLLTLVITALIAILGTAILLYSKER